MTIYDSKFLAGLHIEQPKAHELPEPAPWKVTPDELDEETIAAIDADVTELCRQKFQQLSADYLSLAAVVTKLDGEINHWRGEAIRQRWVIAGLAVALLVAVGIIAR